MGLFRAIILTLLILQPLNINAAEKNGSFTFVQIADTQLGFTNGNNDLQPDIDNFRKAVEQINELKPAFVVISGDLINKPHDPKQVRAFWRVARELSPDIPLYLMPGNHDINGGSADSIRSYMKLFGKDHYSFTYNGAAFIVLNSNLIRSGDAVNKLRDEQLKWFEEELAEARKNGASHIFVLAHHPWFLKDPNEGSEYFNIPPQERKTYLDLMKKYSVSFALAGHYHREAIARDGDLTMITTSAISKGLGKDPVGYRVFKVSRDNVEHSYHAL